MYLWLVKACDLKMLDIIHLNPSTIKKTLMFEKVIENFPSCDKWLFSVNQTIAENTLFKNFLKNFHKDYEVIILEKLTDGQATSCYESLKALDESDSVFIGSCDTIFENKIDLDKSQGFDFTIFTSSPTNLQNKNPKSYGWVVSDSSVKNIFCKENNPTDNLNIILGYFYFDNISYLMKAKFIKEKLYVNGELYIDVMQESFHKIIKSMNIKLSQILLAHQKSMNSFKNER